MKLIILILVSFFIFSCTSKIDEGAAVHTKEASQWQDLASFSGNELKYWGLTISADIIVDKGLSNSRLVLANVRLSKIESKIGLDLLSPKFSELFACDIDCIRLSKLAQINGASKTELAQFFDEEEGKFFRFYGELSELNKRLALYRSVSPDAFGKYIKQLASLNSQHDSLKVFIEDFRANLKVEAWEYFVASGQLNKNKPVQFKTLNGMVDDLPLSDSLIINLPLEADETKNTINSDPRVSWEGNKTIDYISQSGLTTDELVVAKLLKERENRLAFNFNKTSGWEAAKKKRVMVGDVVCTYSNSRFGVVSFIDGDSAKLSVAGQAMMITDGVTRRPQKGYLFSEVREFSFIEVELVEIYALTDVAACDIDYLREGRTAEG